MGWKTEMGMDVLGFTWAEKVGDMFAKSAREGFHVPFSGAFGVRDWISKKSGVKLAGWGAMASGAEAEALGIFEKAGLRKFGVAMSAASSRFEQKVASKVATRYLLGRGAGILMGAANLYFGASMLVGGAYFGYKAISGAVSQYKGLELGGNFMDSQGAATSRQRAIRAITASSLQARSAIGNEAMLMHR